MGCEGYATKEDRDYRRSLIRFLSSQTYNCEITLALNDGSHSLEHIRELSRELFNRVDRKLVGKGHTKRSELRTKGVLFPEKLQTNAHVHGLLWLSPDFIEGSNRLIGTKLTIDEQLSKLYPRGSVDFGWIKDQAGWACYITKEFHRGEFAENFFFLEEFHSRR